jgi:hypothetical protein
MPVKLKVKVIPMYNCPNDNCVTMSKDWLRQRKGFVMHADNQHWQPHLLQDDVNHVGIDKLNNGSCCKAKWVKKHL